MTSNVPIVKHIRVCHYKTPPLGWFVFGMRHGKPVVLHPDGRWRAWHLPGGDYNTRREARVTLKKYKARLKTQEATR